MGCSAACAQHAAAPDGDTPRRTAATGQGNIAAGLDTGRCQGLSTVALSIDVTDGSAEQSIRPPRFGPADALWTSAVSDGALQAGYADEVRSVPSPIARTLVGVAGVPLAVRLAPRLLLDAPGIAPAASGPGWVRLRCASETPERRRCVERQGALLALPTRFGLAPVLLEDASCVARGDTACEYLLHCRSAPRWALVVAATSVGLALGLIARAAPTFVLLLGTLGGAAVYAVERWRAGRANRATRLVSARAFRQLVEGARAAKPTSPEGTGAIVEAPPAHGSDQQPVLEQEGDVWRVTYEGTAIRIRHSRGLALLSHLLRHPGEELHVQALDALVPSPGAGNERMPVNPDTLPADGMSFGLGDAGPVLDDRARADYRRRLAELRTELEDAERCNDPGRAAAARAEIEQLGDELRAATGLGGRARRMSSDVERMRLAVTRRIRAAIEQLGKLHPALGEHLERSVRTGFSCSYVPVEHPDRAH